MEWTNRSAYLFVKARPDQVESLWKKFQGWSHAIGAWVVTGEWDLLVWFDAPSPDAMRTRVAEVRQWDGVDHTASHFVHQGYKNGKYWWDAPTGVWMLSRESGPLDGWKDMTGWDGQVSTASIPGTWDSLSWVWGQDWNQTWTHVMDAKRKGWDTQALVPVRSWWNQGAAKALVG